MGESTTTDPKNPSSPPPGVVVFGSGACAHKITANLSDHGVNAWLAGSAGNPQAIGQGSGAMWLNSVKLAACRGFAGNFQLKLKQKDVFVYRNVPAIVVAEDDFRSPTIAPYGLKPGSRVISISALEEKMDSPLVGNGIVHGTRFAFLCGWENDSHPAIAQRMMAACHRLQKHSGMITYFMTGNLKVSANGAESLVQTAKRSGTRFFKFTQAYPTVQALTDDCFEIDFMDELTRMPFQLKADWIVVDESIGPWQGLAALAQLLEIKQDGSGFAQSDNVRRMSNATNRRGIFVAGGARGIYSADEQMADADQVSLAVLAFLRDLDIDDCPTVEIHRGRCARCLTCHRLCPHQAIEIGPRISVVSTACQRCGICMAGCPARAIDMQGVQIGAKIDNRIRHPAQKANLPEAATQVVVFGCARSAGQACALTRLSGHALPAGIQFIEVPCGGAISSHDLLAAFAAGAHGVMLCTCHADNCQSDIGNRVARKRAESVRELLTAAGIAGDRLNVASVAANMGNEFIAMINGFIDRINILNVE